LPTVRSNTEGHWKEEGRDGKQRDRAETVT
jgi:hypothetical protein